MRGVKKEGFLVKCGAKVKSWKKRYFVLVDVPSPILYYFERQDSMQEKGKIVLESTTIVKPSFSLDKKHIMEVVTQDRTYQIYDDDSSIVDAWIAALNALLGKKLRSLSDPEQPVENLLLSETPISKLLLGTIKACKDFFPAISQYIDLANAYKAKIGAMSETAKSISDLLYTIGSSGAQETATGKELCKIATANKLIETKRLEMRSVYIDQFVIKFQATIDRERAELDQLERKVKHKIHETGS